MLGFLDAKALSRRERGCVAGRRRDFKRRQQVLAAVGQARRGPQSPSRRRPPSPWWSVLALPILGLRLGSSDASTDPASSTTHQAYAVLARGFGPGFNGPLELVGEVHSGATSPPSITSSPPLRHTPGVASVTAAASSPSGTVVLATLYPSTSPQAQPTVDLVNHLRNDVIPHAEQGSTLVVHVGGSTATNIDFAHVLSSKLLLFIGVVVLLAFLLLTDRLS